MKKYLVGLFVFAFLTLSSNVLASGETSGLVSFVHFSSLGDLITKLLPIIFGMVALLAVVIFSIGALRYLVSRGDEKAVDSARSTMTGAVVGLIIVLGAGATNGVLEAVFGQGIIGNNPFTQSPGANNSLHLECAFKVTTGHCIGTQFPTFGSLVTFILLLLLTVGGVAFFFILIWGGIRYMTARGDEKAVTAARNTLTNGAIGLLLMVAAIAIIRLVAEVVFSSGNLISS